MTFFRRYYMKRPSILEHSPYHMLVVCIFLAAKVEERTDLELQKFFNFFYQEHQFEGLHEKPPNQSLLVKLLSTRGNHANSDGLERFRYLEVELCQALGFNLYVHNPLSIIHHVKYELLEHFKNDP